MVWTLSMMCLGMWLAGVVGRAQAGFWQNALLLSGLASGALALALCQPPG